MAERRMFSKSIIDSDAYMNLPLSAQALYFHLSMRADDDGFVGNPKTVIRMVGCDSGDFTLLIESGFIIEFESGIVCIRHWCVNNCIRKDRRNPTVYQDELNSLEVSINGLYETKSTMTTNCQPSDNQTTTQYSIGKVSIGKVSIGKDSLGEDSIGKERNCGGGGDARARENESEEYEKPEEYEEPEESEESWIEQIKYAISLLNEETQAKLVRTTETLVKDYWAQSFCGDYDVCRCYSILSWFKRVCKKSAHEFTLTDEDIELLNEVFSVSAEANRRNWAYIMGIYRKFKSRGIRDIDSYMKYEYERNQGRTCEVISKK